MRLKLCAAMLAIMFFTACKPEAQASSVEVMAKKTRYAWALKKSSMLAKFAHPVKGVRFSPYSYVNVKDDVVFKPKEMEKFFSDEKTYLWGIRDGSGEEIRVKPHAYYLDWIYSAKFSDADLSINKIKGVGNSIENTAEAYPGAQVAEFYFPGTAEYEGMDWGSLRFVFEKYEGKWFLVGVIHNSWTS